MLQVVRVNALAAPIAEEFGLDLVDVELVAEGGRKILRVTLDRAGGLTHEHCEAVSRRLSGALDESDVMGDLQYTLEVSSPGAERPLKTAEDFARFAGRRIYLKGRGPIEGRRHWKGQLVGLAGDAVTVLTEVGELAIPREQLVVVRLSLD